MAVRVHSLDIPADDLFDDLRVAGRVVRVDKELRRNRGSSRADCLSDSASISIVDEGGGVRRAWVK